MVCCVSPLREVRQAMVVGVPDAPCSGFMREMESFTGRIHTQHLAKFLCREEISSQ